MQPTNLEIQPTDFDRQSSAVMPDSGALGSAAYSDAQLYQEASKRVAQKVGFYWHLSSYVIVNALLVFIFIMAGGGYPWFLWPMAGWGVGLVFHFLAVFVFGGTVEASRQRMIEAEMRRLRGPR